MDEEIQVTSLITKTEFSINWGIIRRALEVLLKLAPQELRSPPEYLDEIYEVKRGLKAIYEAEQMEKYSEELNMELVPQDEIKPAVCVNCHVDVKECGVEIFPGSEGCFRRRSKYNVTEPIPEPVYVEPDVQKP